MKKNSGERICNSDKKYTSSNKDDSDNKEKDDNINISDNKEKTTNAFLRDFACFVFFSIKAVVSIFFCR